MTNISNNVMKKVSVIFWARRLTSRRALECYVLFISTLGLFSFVSVPHVIANMPTLPNLAAIGSFFISALTHTHTAVQIVLVLMLVSLSFIAFDFILQSTRRSHDFGRATLS